MNDTKQRIFFTAIDMFSSIGYSDSTMRELAARVGIKTASLYYYYPSKDTLLEEIFDYFIENDKKYRKTVENIAIAAERQSIPEILSMMYIRYVDDESFHFMIKILKIAIGFQFECEKAKEVFQYIYYDLALKFRQSVFKELIDRHIIEPFDYMTVAYTMTAYSLMQFMEATNNATQLSQYTEYYNSGVDKLIALVSPFIHKA